MDENFPSGAWRPAANLFRMHQFDRVGHDIQSGMKDLELFKMASDRGYDVFVTGDVKQMRIESERKACREARMHWIGVPPNPKAIGKARAHGQIARLVSSLHLIVKQLENSEVPQALLFEPNNHKLEMEDGYPQDL